MYLFAKWYILNAKRITILAKPSKDGGAKLQGPVPFGWQPAVKRKRPTLRRAVFV